MNDDVKRKIIKVSLKLNNEEKQNLYNKCFESKNAYNHYIFIANFFYKFKEGIYEKLIDQLKIKHINPQNELIRMLTENFKIYSNNYEFMKTNNSLIYKFIHDDNPIIFNYNFDKKFKYYLDECKKLDGITVNAHKFIYDDIIKNILISFYKKNYRTVKNGILNHIKLDITDNKFIDHIKNDKILFNDYPKFFKKLKQICTQKKLEITTERNILTRFAYSTFKRNNVSSDIVINSFDKANLAFSSYFSLRKKGMYAKSPRYKKKDELFQLSLSGKCIVNRANNENYIKVLLGDKSSILIEKPYILKKNGTYSEIKRIEIIPTYNGFDYIACIGYVYNEHNINNDDNYKTHLKDTSGMISIDLGMANLMTIYNPTGYQKIIKGGDLINTNEYYNKRISESKSNNMRSNKNSPNGLSKETKRLLTKRENVLNHKMDKIVNIIYDKYKNKKEIIIGYNENWKQNINIGRNNNRKFYEIPYRRLINKMYNKFEHTRITEVWEGYTSKCDALSLESLGRHDEYQGKRIKRGLFNSSKKKQINADLNGAINIMRRYCKNNKIIFEQVKGYKIMNPITMRLNDNKDEPMM